MSEHRTTFRVVCAGCGESQDIELVFTLPFTERVRSLVELLPAVTCPSCGPLDVKRKHIPEGHRSSQNAVWRRRARLAAGELDSPTGMVRMIRASPRRAR